MKKNIFHHNFLTVAMTLLAAVSCNSAFDPDRSHIPMCSDSSDSTVVFVDIKTGEKASGTYKGAYLFYDGINIVLEKEGWTFIDKDFKRPIDDHFKDITHFSNGLALSVKPNECIKAIDMDGNVIFEMPEASLMYAFNDGYAVYQDAKTHKYGVIDTEGNIVINAKYDALSEREAGCFVIDGRLIIGKKDPGDNEIKYGLIDMDGNEIIPAKYQDIRYVFGAYSVFRERMKTFSYTKRCGLFGKDGEELYDFEYPLVIKDGSYYLFMTDDQEIGWMNEDKEEIISPYYSNTMGFNNAKLAAVGVSENIFSQTKWGYIDTDGEWVIRPKYAKAYEFKENGKAIVQNGYEEYGVIDEAGEKAITIDKQEIEHITGDYYLVTTDSNTIGIMLADGNGTWTARPTFEECETIRWGPSVVIESDFIDLKGISETLKSVIESLSSTTLDDIVYRYDLSRESFSKYWGSSVTLINESMNMYSVRASLEDVRGWTETDDYTTYDWFQSRYRFDGNQKINEYKVTLSLQGKYLDKTKEIRKHLMSEFGVGEGSTFFKYKEYTVKVRSGYGEMELYITIEN